MGPESADFRLPGCHRKPQKCGWPRELVPRARRTKGTGNSPELARIIGSCNWVENLLFFGPPQQAARATRSGIGEPAHPGRGGEPKRTLSGAKWPAKPPP